LAFEITNRADLERQKQTIQYNIVLEIDGVSTLYGGVLIKEIIKYGSAGLTFGTSAQIYGGLAEIADQDDSISFEGTSTSIQQQLRPDQGNVSSVQSLSVALLDTNNAITKLISPGVTLTDMLARKCKIWFGFKESSWPEDYIVLHRGIVSDIDSKPGLIILTVSHSDNKKRQKIFEKADTLLDGSIGTGDTTLTVDATANFLAPVLGPDGANDAAIKFYVRIDDEIIEYTGTTGTTFTGGVRGSLGTTAATHDDDAKVESFYVLEEVAMELALKLMLSGWTGPFKEDEPITNFVQVGDGSTVANAIFFLGINVETEYGLTLGDYITTTGASNGANNVTLKQITDIVIQDQGSYIVIGGESFVIETSTSAVIDFRSQYDTLGEGLKMSPDEVDVAEHLRLRDLFLSSFNYRFYLKDTIEAQEFLEKEVYAPASAFSVPRKARSSVGIHSAPIPGDITITFDKTNIQSPDKITLKRKLGRHFFNTIVHKFDIDELEDKFQTGVINTDATSKTQIPIGNKTRTIEGTGMRSDLNAANLANQAASRVLDRYKFAAEHFESIRVFFKDGFQVEPGDRVLFDPTDLKISDTSQGDRTKDIRFFEVLNKKMNIKTGDISLALIDTNFTGQDRFALICPASKVKQGNSTSQLVVKKSFSTTLANEGKKWEDFVGTELRVRSPDGTTRNDTAILDTVAGDVLTFTSALSFTPLVDDLVEFSEYNNQIDQAHLIFAFMNDTSFPDGTDQYSML